jgi:hypothetical protein
MRVKVVFKNPKTNLEEHYLRTIPHHLKLICDLQNYFYEKFELDNYYPNISSNKQSFSLYIDGYQIPAHEKISDIIKEDETIRIEFSSQNKRKNESSANEFEHSLCSRGDDMEIDSKFFEFISEVQSMRTQYGILKKRKLGNENTIHYKEAVEIPSQYPKLQEMHPEKHQKTPKTQPKSNLKPKEELITSNKMEEEPRNVVKVARSPPTKRKEQEPTSVSTKPNNTSTKKAIMFSSDSSESEDSDEEIAKPFNKNNNNAKQKSRPDQKRHVPTETENEIKITNARYNDMHIRILTPEEEFENKKKQWSKMAVADVFKPKPPKKQANQPYQPPPAVSSPYQSHRKQDKDKNKMEIENYPTWSLNHKERREPPVQQAHSVRPANAKKKANGIRLKDESTLTQNHTNLPLNKLVLFWQKEHKTLLQAGDKIKYKCDILDITTFQPVLSELKSGTIHNIDVISGKITINKDADLVKQAQQNNKEDSDEEDGEEVKFVNDYEVEKDQEDLLLPYIKELWIDNASLNAQRLEEFKNLDVMVNLIAGVLQETNTILKNNPEINGKSAPNSDKKPKAETDKSGVNKFTLEKLLGDQIDHYFSDRSYWKDSFIQQHIAKDPEGYMPLNLMLNFPRIRDRTRELDKVRDAVREQLEKNPLCNFELDASGMKIRKKLSIPTQDTVQVT